MKKTLSFLGICALTLHSQAAPVVSENFNSFPSGTMASWLSDPAGVTNADYAPADNTQKWITTSVDSTGSASLVGISGYSHSLSDKWAQVGGIPLGTSGQSLSGSQGSQVDVWTPLSTAWDVNASILFGIQRMAYADNTDTFGWTVRNTAGTEIFGVVFHPYTTPTPPQDAYGNPTQLGIAWVDSNGVQHETTEAVVFQGEYQMNLSLNLRGNNANPGVPVFTLGIQGVSPTDSVTPDGPLMYYSGVVGTGEGSNDYIGSIAATWLPTDFSNLGSNTMSFDNYIVAVPEPSTVALALGGLGLMAMLRRRRS